jgi:hypothetical protein
MKEENKKSNNDKVEVYYTVPIERKIMIPENAIEDWEDEEEIIEYIQENAQGVDENVGDDITITSIG